MNLIIMKKYKGISLSIRRDSYIFNKKRKKNILEKN